MQSKSTMYRHNPYDLKVFADSDRFYSAPSRTRSTPSSMNSTRAPGLLCASDLLSAAVTPSSRAPVSPSDCGATLTSTVRSTTPCESSMNTVTTPAKSVTKTPNTDAVANHYKTRPCKTFQANGHCSYESFCRFAHGASDLRTYAQNVRAGLVTEEAIRAHQRAEADRKGGRKH